jgi:hypothetical protein
VLKEYPFKRFCRCGACSCYLYRGSLPRGGPLAELAREGSHRISESRAALPWTAHERVIG